MNNSSTIKEIKEGLYKDGLDYVLSLINKFTTGLCLIENKTEDDKFMINSFSMCTDLMVTSIEVVDEDKEEVFNKWASVISGYLGWLEHRIND